MLPNINETTVLQEVLVKMKWHFDCVHENCILCFVAVSLSAGVGRTGTYIGLDALWKEGFKTGSVDILSFARKMRKNRTKMIQTLVSIMKVPQIHAYSVVN